MPETAGRAADATRNSTVPTANIRPRQSPLPPFATGSRSAMLHRGRMFRGRTVLSCRSAGAPAVLAFLERLPDYSSAGLRAAGDDAGPRVGWLAGGGVRARRRLYLRSRRFPSSLAHAFIAPRTRILRPWRASTFRASRAPAVVPAEFGSSRRPQGASDPITAAGRQELLTTRFRRGKVKEGCSRSRSNHLLEGEDLELYLNEIYLGLGSYGIAAASPAVF